MQPILVSPPPRLPPVFIVGSGMGFAGLLTALVILIAACFGFDAVMAFSLVPLLLGTAGLVLTCWGSFRTNVDDSRVVAGLFLSLLAITGGLLELVIWQRWTVLYGQAR